MSDHENDDLHPAGDDGDAAARAPRPATLRLASAVGSRLRAPLPRDRRDVLAARLAAVAADVDAGGIRRRPRRIVLRRPAALIGALSVLAVLVAVVGVVERSADDLPVIALGAGGGAGLPGMAAATQEAPAPEMLRELPEPLIGMWAPTRYTFLLEDGVATDVDRATGWRSVAPSDLRAAAARVAAVFGLPAPVPSPEDASSLMVTADDGASLWVAANGDWFYSGPADLWPAWDCPVEADDADAEADAQADPDDAAERRTECAPPAPPAGVPTAARARALAGELLAAVGVTGHRVSDVHVDEWSAWVTVGRPLPDGSDSGLGHAIAFAGGERVASASGSLAVLEPLGEYPLVDPAAALVRLEDELNGWLDGGPGTAPMPRPAPEVLPTEPMPSPEELEQVEPVDRTVVVTALEVVTNMAWTADGGLVLLPHYRLVDADGSWWFVVALEDRHLSD